jgi:hypothetical protein
MAKVWRILKSTQGKKSRLDPALNDGACAALMVKVPGRGTERFYIITGRGLDAFRQRQAELSA